MSVIREQLTTNVLQLYNLTIRIGSSLEYFWKSQVRKVHSYSFKLIMRLSTHYVIVTDLNGVYALML